MNSIPFTVDGYSSQAFAYSLCQHKKWSGKREKQAKSIVQHCDDWSREDRLLKMAHMYGGRGPTESAQRSCERYVRRQIKVGWFSWGLGQLIVFIVRLFIAWYLQNYDKVRAAQGE